MADEGRVALSAPSELDIALSRVARMSLAKRRIKRKDFAAAIGANPRRAGELWSGKRPWLNREVVAFTEWLGIDIAELNRKARFDPGSFPVL